MSLADYVRLLRRRGWILIAAAVLTAVSAFVFSRVQTEVWKATILLSVTPSRPDFGLTESAKKFLRNYVLIIQSKTFAQKVIDELQMDRTAEDLLGHVVIASDDSRFAIQIDVESESPEEANAVAAEWAEQFVQWRNAQNALVRREDQVDAIVVDPPRLTLDSPKTSVNTLAGGLLGLLLGGVIIFLLEYLESNVLRSPQDIERALSLSVLGAIPVFEAGRRK
jgi:capsular polysaccharide biosynthesis protein